MGKIRALLRDKRNTTQFKLSVRIIGLLVITVVVLSTSILAVTIKEMYESTENQGEMIKTAITNRDMTSQSDWKEALLNIGSSDDAPYYMRVRISDQKPLYSFGGQKQFEDFASFKQFILFEQIIWSEHFQPFYYLSFTHDGAVVSLLIDISGTFTTIRHIVSLSLLLSVFFILIGTYFAVRFSKQQSAALAQMNSEIQAINMNDDGNSLLTEPESPQEVQHVSKSFNELLTKQRNLMKREKQFVSDASHELRTPVAAIRGHMNLIKRRGEAHPEVVPKSLEYIDKESKRMEHLVAQLLTLGRVEKLGEAEMVDLASITLETVEEMRVVMPQELVLDICSTAYVLGNKEHMYQIVRNLLENAIKYTPEYGEISASVSIIQDKCGLTIADNGIGIPDEEKTHIFERFYRVDQSRSSEIKGTGIGLSIVKELVEKYHGEVKVTDGQTGGSIFQVTFPCGK